MADGDVAAFEQASDLLGVDVIVLGLAAMDRLREERRAEDEWDFLHAAQIGDPVPGE